MGELEQRLRTEIAAREAAEREVAELQAEKHQLEERVINANRTLAYGLGKALIDARSFKGMMALPGRIRRLRLKQKAKRREHVPDTIPTGVAKAMRLVDPALEKARAEGVKTAAEWVRRQVADNAAKSRALSELAVSVLQSDQALGRRLVAEAEQLNVGDARLVSVAAFFDDDGNASVTATPGEIALAASEFELEGEGRTIGCVATLTDDPNLRNVLEAFASLYEAGAAARLAFIGNGPAKAALAGQAAGHNIDGDVHFLGMPAPQRWAALLGCCDVVLFPCAYAEPEGSEIALWMEQLDGAAIKNETNTVIFPAGWQQTIK